MMGILSMLSSAFRSERQLASRLDLDDTMSRIGFFVSNGTACTTYFQNRTFNPDPVAILTEVIGDVAAEEFSIFAPGAPTSIIAQKDLSLGPHLKIERLEVRNLMLVAGSTYLGSLTVYFQSTASNGPQNFVRELYLSLNTVPEVVGGVTLAKIVSCNAQSTSKGFSQFSVFYANSTFTIPPQVDRVMIEVWGAGGGGGGGFTDNTLYCSGGGGGGAGGYARSILTVTPGTAYPITVGMGGLNGNGTAAGPATSGAPGGSSSFGVLVTAQGGGGGTAGYVGSIGTGGIGGTSVGQDVITGDNGKYSEYNYFHPQGAEGGSGGRGAQSVGNGGHGGNAFAVTAHRSGYPGTNGKVIVWW